MRRSSFNHQQGYFLLIAMIFILVIGVMGIVITYMLSNRALVTAAMLNGLKAFYLAESGLEAGARLLTMPTIAGTPKRLACAAVNGNTATTNAGMGAGTFTLTSVNSPVSAVSALSSAVTASATTIPTASSAGFAAQGRILIDREAIDYASITGNTFNTVNRGANGTLASSHAINAPVSQYQCSLDVQAGIPSVSSPSFKRDLQWNVELQDAWAVGAVSGSNLVLTHWNKPTEMTFNPVTVASSNAVTLNGVSMLSNSDGWAVGNASGSNFVLAHWNGTSWIVSTVSGACSGQNLNDISMISSQSGWAVGATYKPSCGGGGGVKSRYGIMRWNGSAWTLVNSGIPVDSNSNGSLSSVHVIDTTGDGVGDFGFAVGSAGDILQYNGSSWTKITSPTTQTLNGVYVVSANEAWAIGNSGVILKWNGSSFSSFASPTTTQLNGIDMLDTNGDGFADIGWAVGNTGRILMYNGSSWISQSSSGNNLLSIAIFDSNDAIAVGASGTALRWDGSTWTSIATGVTQQLNFIDVVSRSYKPVSIWRQVFH